MNPGRLGLVSLITVLTIVLALGTAPGLAEAQFGKRILQIGACGGGAFAGVKLGDKIAEMEARRLKLSPAEAAKRKKAFQIGMGLALCGGGALIAGTSYSKLSKHGQESREKEISAALEDAMPRVYKDPDNPQLQGRVTPQPAFTDGNDECRIVEDQLAPDEALVKYCRTPPSDKWMVKSV